jgi:hypothetical protein
MCPDQFKLGSLVRMYGMVGELIGKPFIMEMMSSAAVEWKDGPLKGCVRHEWCHRLDILSPEEEAMYRLARL